MISGLLSYKTRKDIKGNMKKIAGILEALSSYNLL